MTDDQCWQFISEHAKEIAADAKADHPQAKSILNIYGIFVRGGYRANEIGILIGAIEEYRKVKTIASIPRTSS